MSALSIARKILIGKIVRFNPSFKENFVIVGVRYNPLYKNHFDVLIAKLWNDYEIEVYSWYAYSQKSFYFVSRSPKWMIRKCLKLNPEYVKYHIGKVINVANFRHVSDRSNYYKEYCNQIVEQNV
ncbi:MAG TPA: hypothetical protein VK172_10575 [Lentimicrobium sp.]|nr:hypothetical protein [Lentimicrobium sp.]